MECGMKKEKRGKKSSRRNNYVNALESGGLHNNHILSQLWENQPEPLSDAIFSLFVDAIARSL